MDCSFETLLRAATALEHRIHQVKTAGIPYAQARRNNGIELLLKECLAKDRVALAEIKMVLAQ
jgi:hypothetical protein